MPISKIIRKGMRMTEEKTRFKMYKAKKRWVVAGVTMFSAVLGTTALASADTVNSTPQVKIPVASSVASSQSTSNASEVTTESQNNKTKQTVSSSQDSEQQNSKETANGSSMVQKNTVASTTTISFKPSVPVKTVTQNSNGITETPKTQTNPETVKKVQTQLQSNLISEPKTGSSSVTNVSTTNLNAKNSAVSQSQESAKVQSNAFAAHQTQDAQNGSSSSANKPSTDSKPFNTKLADLTSESSTPLKTYDGLQNDNFETDKATYAPGDVVHGSLTIQNTYDIDQWGTWKLKVYNPLTDENDAANGTWKTPKNQSTTITFDWKAPNVDDQGYVLDLQLFTSTGKLLTEYTNAVDVDTDPYKHPRYGALTDFSSGDLSKEKAMVDSLAKAYHLNMQMLYDCYFEPQDPLPDQDSWKNWHGDTISKQAIQTIINQIHQDGGKAFFYDMIGATSDKSMPQTGFYNPDTGDWLNANLGNGNYQYYHDIANAEWQNYIIPIVVNQAKAMGFDGWQGDTPGALTGNSYDQIKDKSKAFSDSDYYHYFASAVMDYLKKNGPDFAFGLNSVNAAGQTAIAKDSNDTFDYSELWPSNYPTYGDIANVIEQNWQNDHKPLVVPAYLYNQWRDAQTNGKVNDLPKTYNDNAVRQLVATIMATGGSPMILADGGYLIDDQYYPWMRMENGKQINMSNALGDPQTGYMRHYFDFDTAYENILQDPNLSLTKNYLQVWNGNGVGKGDWINRDDAESNTVYAFAKSNGKNLDTINLVNLMGSTNQWQVNNTQDNNSHNVQSQKNLWIKYYPSEQEQNIKHVYLSSPDNAYQGKRIEVPFKEYTDPSGHKYVEFEVPSLEIWDLVYMTTDELASSTSGSSSETKPNASKDMNSSSSTNSSDVDKPSTDNKPSSGSSSNSDKTTTVKPANPSGTNNGSNPDASKDTNKGTNSSSSASDDKGSVSGNTSSSTSSNKPTDTNPSGSSNVSETTSDSTSVSKPDGTTDSPNTSESNLPETMIK